MKKRVVTVGWRAPDSQGFGDQVLLSQRVKMFHDAGYIVQSYYLFNSSVDAISEKISTPKKIRMHWYDWMYMILLFVRFYPLQTCISYRKELKKVLDNSNFDYLLMVTCRMFDYSKFAPSGCIKIFDFIDSLYVNYRRRSSGILLIPIKLYESWALRRFETSTIYKSIGLKVFVSFKDYNVLMGSEKVHAENVLFSPISVDIPKPIGKINNTNLDNTIGNFKKLKIGFGGNMNYFANRDAIFWFLENVWSDYPELRENATICVAGRNIDEPLYRKLSSFEGVVIVGEVVSMKDFYAAVDVVIAPMINGSGMQNKILEALSVGKQVITTNVGAGDLRRLGAPISIVDKPIEFRSLLNSYITGLRDIENHEAWPYIKRVHGHENINQIFLKKLNGVKI